MPTLEQCLAALPHRDLRGVATRLRVRRCGEHCKTTWIEGVLQAWLTPADQPLRLAHLSPAAIAAATRLAQAGEFPVSLFLAEYGAVRRPRPGQRWPPPWESPQTVSEELYYSGLLAAIPAVVLEKAQRLALPADLRQLFLAQAPPAQPAASSGEPGPAAALWHDTAQTLSFLVELAASGSPHLPLLYGRWLAPGALIALNSRLLRPEAGPEPARRRAPLPRSHARAPRLRFLFFLTAAAGLQAAGAITPTGWSSWCSSIPRCGTRRAWRSTRRSTS